jgi:hypothetical protein
MPVSSPGWFNDLPEHMTEAEYRDLSEEISRAIEIVHGHVIRRESPVPRHNRIARRLSFALEAARSPAGPCLTVETDVDEYATAGIPLYLVVVLDEKYDIREIREFHLDAAAAAYRLHAIPRSVLELEQPVRLTLPIADLESA